MYVYIYICVCVCVCARALPSRGLNTLAKELMAATHVRQTSFNESSTLVSDNAKWKQAKADT